MNTSKISNIKNVITKKKARVLPPALHLLETLTGHLSLAVHSNKPPNTLPSRGLPWAEGPLGHVTKGSSAVGDLGLILNAARGQGSMNCWGPLREGWAPRPQAWGTWDVLRTGCHVGSGLEAPGAPLVGLEQQRPQEASCWRAICVMPILMGQGLERVVHGLALELRAASAAWRPPAMGWEQGLARPPSNLFSTPDVCGDPQGDCWPCGSVWHGEVGRRPLPLPAQRGTHSSGLPSTVQGAASERQRVLGLRCRAWGETPPCCGPPCLQSWKDRG